MGRHVLLAQNGLFRPQASAAGQSRAKGAYSAFSACCKLILAHSGRYMQTTSPGKYRERRGMLLPITLTFAATAALLHLLLEIRVSLLRVAYKILHGDGGNVALDRRTSTHANIIAYTPITIGSEASRGKW